MMEAKRPKKNKKIKNKKYKKISDSLIQVEEEGQKQQKESGKNVNSHWCLQQVGQFVKLLYKKHRETFQRGGFWNVVQGGKLTGETDTFAQRVR